jgi:glycosyltransferase involved in cell wall biosynthesis
MEKAIKEAYGNLPSIVIPNASDTKLFGIERTMPKVFPETLKGRKIILYTGSLGLMDDCEMAVKAMAFFLDKPLALVIIGEGMEREHLQKLAQETENPNIYFLGLLPKTEIVKWYSVATASFVGFKNSPVLSTSSPNKMFDSFAAGVPIIQNTTGWIAELVRNEKCGINVEPNNLNLVVDAYLEILSNSDYLKSLGENARKLAETRFNRDYLAKTYLDAMINLG